MLVAPCKGCKKRYSTCHVSCTEYSAYKKKLNFMRTKGIVITHGYDLWIRESEGEQK